MYYSEITNMQTSLNSKENIFSEYRMIEIVSHILMVKYVYII